MNENVECACKFVWLNILYIYIYIIEICKLLL